MLCNTTVVFCWLFWWKCCKKMEIWTFDRLFHPSNCVFFKKKKKRCHPCSPFFSSFAYVWPKWSTFLHKTTWQFYPWKKKCSPLFRMTLLDSDTLLCLIKLINCLMDHKSANTLMGPGVLCWFKSFYITLSKVYGTNPALISTTSLILLLPV